MAAVGVRALAEIRRRWRSLLVLVLLVAVFGGASIAAAAGARRTGSSFDRLLEDLGSPDLALGEDSALDEEAARRISKLPEVAQASRAAFLLASPEGVSLFGVGAVAPAGGGWSRRMDRSLVVAGRLPEQLDEVAVNESMRDRLGIRLGDRVPYVTYAPEQLEDIFFGTVTEPEGPRLMMRVVGVVRHPLHLTAGSGVADDTLFAPGFYDRYADEIIAFGPTLYVTLRDGVADLDTFTRGVRAIEADLGRRAQQASGPIVDDLEITIGNLHESRYAIARNAIQVQETALSLFAGVLALAALLIVGQALARAATTEAGEQLALRALGFSPRQVLLAAVVPAGLTVVAGIAGAIVGAVGASALFPTGLAARAEPRPGIDVDWMVLFVGGAVFGLALLAWGAWSAHRSIVRARRRSLAEQVYPSAVASMFARGTRSPSAALGVRMALEPGRGRTAVPVRTAILTAMAAVVALSTVTGIGASLQRLIDTPRLYGWPADAMVSGGDDPASLPETAARLETFDGIAEFSSFELADVVLEGRTVQGFGIRRIRGDVFLPIIEGREPVGADEIVLGSQTMRRLGRTVGDVVSVSNTGAGEEVEEEGFRRVTRRLTIVGRAAFPSIDQNPIDDAAALSGDGYDALAPIPDFPVMFVRFDEGVDHDGMIERLKQAFGDTNASGSERPGEVENLARVSGLPWVLSAFLVLLAVGAGGHALVTTVRRRSHDLAILKAIGFRRRQILATVGWQAATFALAGVVVGLPVGIAAGRWSWSILGERLGIPVEPVIAAAVVAVILPLGLVLLNLLISAGPARVAARTEPAVILRSE